MTRATDIAVELYGELRAAKAKLRQRRGQVEALRRRLDDARAAAARWCSVADRQAAEATALRAELSRAQAERDALAKENARLVDIKCDVCRAWWGARGKR
jgi:chromosome segregation ATPase